MIKERFFDLAREIGLETEDIENFVECPIRSYEINTNCETANPFDLYKVGGHYGTISIKDF